jgi:TPR repeat protein
MNPDEPEPLDPAGGKPHRKKRPSTKERDEYGTARKKRDRGREKADKRRKWPRRKPKGWKGAGHRARPERPSLSGNAKGKQTPHREKMTGKSLYEEALRLALLAEKTDGPWPIAPLREAAATGYSPALYALATWHLFGRGVKKDFKKAFSLLLESAEQNYAPAEYDIAVSFEMGKGTTKSEESAFLYYRRAAEHGDVAGMTEVARCYWFGIGTAQDCRKAANWYLKAARRGDAESQTTIAHIFEYGEGASRNLDKAIYWYEKAAAQLEPEALRVLKELNSNATT